VIRNRRVSRITHHGSRTTFYVVKVKPEAD